ARTPVEGQDPDPRPARLGHDAGRVGHDHRARPAADARHGGRVPVAAAARRPEQGVRAERPAPRPEDRAPGRVGHDLGPAGHSTQPARRAAARIRLSEERDPGDRGRDRRGAGRASPRSGAGVRRIRGQRRLAAGGGPRRVPVAGAPLSLEIPRGEILVLLGPSGSGKTTVLRLLGGFEAPDAGRIVLAGEDVTAVPPARRRCGMVFQHYALFPHLDVGENVAFGLAGRGTREAGRVEGEVAEVLGLVGLEGFERRRVQELSGGQQRRVALARALAPEPQVLLLDEPLSNLDPSLRERTRRELRALIERVGITTIFVTHEQEEAFDLGDRVAVLQAGRLEQLATPDELYEHPTSLFVATFVARANVLRGKTARALGAGPGELLVGRPEWLLRAGAGVPRVV